MVGDDHHRALGWQMLEALDFGIEVGEDEVQNR
jgi:hypothetical protein